MTGPGSYGWDYAEGNGSTGPGALSSYAYTFEEAGEWSTWSNENPYYLEVNVDTAVPEPATWALLAAGVAALLTGPSSRSVRRRFR